MFYDTLAHSSKMCMVHKKSKYRPRRHLKRSSCQLSLEFCAAAFNSVLLNTTGRLLQDKRSSLAALCGASCHSFRRSIWSSVASDFVASAEDRGWRYLRPVPQRNVLNELYRRMAFGLYVLRIHVLPRWGLPNFVSGKFINILKQS